MTIEKYLESMDYVVPMKILGELKNFRYYIEKDPPDSDDGEPFIVIENKKSNEFEICGSEQRFAILDLFS